MRKWARQILSGLDYLHLKDPPVIHGDLRCDKVCPTRLQDTVDPSAVAAGLECVGQVCRAWKALCDLKRGRGCPAHPLLTGPLCCADLHQWSQRGDKDWRLGPSIPSAQALPRRHDRGILTASVNSLLLHGCITVYCRTVHSRQAGIPVCTRSGFDR